MMDELKDVKKFLNPTEVLLVVDTMTGQEASALVTTFDVEIGITGATLTKLDGAALSLKEQVIAKLEGVVVIQYCALRLLQFVNLQATVDESLYDVSFKLQKMENEEGQVTFLLLLLITSKDHAYVQLNIGHLDADGVYTGQFTTFSLCGFVRAQGDADSGVDRLW
ncbi:PREDICTED: uncharacterized protein LOC104700234 isoform X7 [Camelina sativa]|uniref:Uncharacterized protein LOC104700234 isoform X7 n=1 Tax=Camelina sativa TaxID=90675 RepID=A0ABM1Q8A1_CAMSA|nr:PREDICTED: uncharacterized protein LOC104700234 isoform X7 [Camelina sativa]